MHTGRSSPRSLATGRWSPSRCATTSLRQTSRWSGRARGSGRTSRPDPGRSRGRQRRGARADL